jgi:SHS family lactate transporter-like MFS transporter
MAIPMWALPSGLGKLAAGAFMLQFMAQGAWGVIPAHINELSPDSIRGCMPGFAYQCGNLLASYVVQMEAGLAQHWDYGAVMAISAGTFFLLAIFVTAIGREKRGGEFGALASK